jgi:hypothetical protein
LKSALTVRSWKSLVGWSSLSTEIGASVYSFTEYLDGNFTSEDVIVGGIGGLLALPGGST